MIVMPENIFRAVTECRTYSLSVLSLAFPFVFTFSAMAGEDKLIDRAKNIAIEKIVDLLTAGQCKAVEDALDEWSKTTPTSLNGLSDFICYAAAKEQEVNLRVAGEKYKAAINVLLTYRNTLNEKSREELQRVHDYLQVKTAIPEGKALVATLEAVLGGTSLTTEVKPSPTRKLPANQQLFVQFPVGSRVPRSLPVKISDQILQSAELRNSGSGYYLWVSRDWWGGDSVPVSDGPPGGGVRFIIKEYGRVSTKIYFGDPVKCEYGSY